MSDSIRDITRKQMYEAISEGRVADARELLNRNPELRTSGGVHRTWLHDAAGYGSVDMLSMLIEEGFDVNARDGKMPDGPLSWTLGRGHLDAARLLLDRGASPNVGRLLIGAINAKKNAFELVKLLVDRGADVNQRWRFGDEEHCPLFNALSWAIDNRRDDIAEFLRTHGAIMPPEEPVKAATNADRWHAHDSKSWVARPERRQE